MHKWSWYLLVWTGAESKHSHASMKHPTQHVMSFYTRCICSWTLNAVVWALTQSVVWAQLSSGHFELKEERSEEKKIDIYVVRKSPAARQNPRQQIVCSTRSAFNGTPRLKWLHLMIITRDYEITALSIYQYAHTVLDCRGSFIFVFSLGVATLSFSIQMRL